MKKIGLLLIFAVLIIILFFSFFKLNGKNKDNKPKNKKIQKIENIKSMNFSYSTSTEIDSNVRYEIKKENDKYFAIIKLNNMPNESEKKVEIDKNFVNNVIEILNKYNVYSWNKFNKSDSNVLDGTGFYFSLLMENNKTIKASGYEIYPKNYGYVRGALDEIFENLYNE